MTERTAEDWGRLAVSLPGWRWMPGMRWCMPSSAPGPMRGRMVGDSPSALLLLKGWPDPDDPATAGCLLALLGPVGAAQQILVAGGYGDGANLLHAAVLCGKNIGRACIAAAEAIGEWSGGEA